MIEPQQKFIRKPEWHYLNLEIISDLQVGQISHRKVEIEFDKITWKAIVLSSLRKLYGIVGESSHFDILQTKENRSLMRVHQQDVEKFINSFFAFTFKLNKYINGLDDNMNAYIKVIKSADFLGMALDEYFYE